MRVTADRDQRAGLNTALNHADVVLVLKGGQNVVSRAGASSATLNGDAYGQQLGYGMTSIGDQDGDGYGDVAVGARGDSTEAREGGAVFVFYGPLSGDQTPDDADASWFGTSAGAGTRVAGGVELTGDAYTDLLISPPAGRTTRAP